MSTKVELSNEEWLRRCAARFVERGGLSASTAMECAQACSDSRDDDLHTPEEAADEDMACWND